MDLGTKYGMSKMPQGWSNTRLELQNEAGGKYIFGTGCRCIHFGTISLALFPVKKKGKSWWLSGCRWWMGVNILNF